MVKVEGLPWAKLCCLYRHWYYGLLRLLTIHRFRFPFRLYFHYSVPLLYSKTGPWRYCETSPVPANTVLTFRYPYAGEGQHRIPRDLMLSVVFAHSSQARPSRGCVFDDAAVFTLCYGLLTCAHLCMRCYIPLQYRNRSLHWVYATWFPGLTMTGLTPASTCKLSWALLE